MNFYVDSVKFSRVSVFLSCVIILSLNVTANYALGVRKLRRFAKLVSLCEKVRYTRKCEKRWVSPCCRRNSIQEFVRYIC